MLSKLSRFFTRGTISGIGAVIVWFAGRYGYGDIAASLTDPEVLQKIFDWVAAGLAIYAGISQGIQHNQPVVISEVPKFDPIGPKVPVQPDLSDPYPGWDWDPVKGWVRTDGQ